MRYLAIDPGDKRTGLAVGDDDTKIASPLSVITTTSKQQRLVAIGQAIQDHDPEALVLGLPLNMNGSEGPAAQKARFMAAELAQHFDLPIHLIDERLTSDEADQKMARSGLTHKGKKRRRDAMAAAAILLRFLERT